MTKRHIALLLALFSSIAAGHAQSPSTSERARWAQRAAQVTIVRDDWGIAHVYGKTDADAVFGMIYAQAEDDFNRVETNYLNALGRLAETEGDSRIYQDLRMKLFIDPEELKQQYASSPEWLKTLMQAFADGANFYLERHPTVKPRVIHHFEPWMALSFTEGSIGGDIERVDLKELQSFYETTAGRGVALRRVEENAGPSAPLRSGRDDKVGSLPVSHEKSLHLDPLASRDPLMHSDTLGHLDPLASRDIPMNRDTPATRETLLFASGMQSFVIPTGAQRSGGTCGFLHPPQTCRQVPENKSRERILPNDVSEVREPGGSNGIAIAPSNTAAHHALLLINPHTSFFFRSELEMTSEEGLDAYGAVTWGQFFVYQGFNSRAGWMHTSSGVDAVDEYLETVHRVNGHYTYQYGDQQKLITQKQITVRYKTAHGIAEKHFTAYYTEHGPVIRQQDGKWVTIRLMQEHVKALMQSYLRTKAHTYPEYLRTMELQANSSNNTIYADADGHIAYFHGNYIPRRNPRFDFTQPVDGSDPATDWQGLLTVQEAPHLLDPHSGYLFNVNDSPWNGAGESSLRRNDFPAYVETGSESARGLHAIRVLQGKKDFTLDSLTAAAYDSYLPWFIKPLFGLQKAWDDLPSTSEIKGSLAPQIAVLRAWDLRWNVDSIATSLAIFWGQEVLKAAPASVGHAAADVDEFLAPSVPPDVALKALQAASAQLTADFGSWQTPWGMINRYQRLNGDIVQRFNDDAPSGPVGFVSSRWGSLASFGARPYTAEETGRPGGTKKWYGTSGNSFVAVVEFGDKVRARAVTAGGESGHPRSRHFNDQVQRYSEGRLREVYFYRDQLKGHTERTYHPG